MKRLVVPLFLLMLLSTDLASQSAENSANSISGATGFIAGVKSAIEKNLGRPYVWGSSGLKSFDCSGFIWRVMYENGILLKRTTARKFYMMLPPVSNEEKWNFGTLVFFDNLKHVGIVETPHSFYHAQVSAGTNRSEMNSYWRPRIYGFRRIPPIPSDDH